MLFLDYIVILYENNDIIPYSTKSLDKFCTHHVLVQAKTMTHDKCNNDHMHMTIPDYKDKDYRHFMMTYVC